MRQSLVLTILLSAATAIILVAPAAVPLLSSIEQAPYKVERAEGAFELRAYPELTVATLTVVGSRDSAINRGFRTLAGYIFGGNKGSKKIEMTAPVMQSRGAENRDWTIRFIMPHSWSLDDLPKPKDTQVTLETVKAGRFAVIRFSGFWRDALLRQKTNELLAAMDRNGWVASGPPIYAFFNPPWTLPMFRRNEVMIETRS